MHRFSKPLLLLLLTTLLCAGSRQDADTYLTNLIQGWDTTDASALRFRISSDRTVKAMIIWDRDDQRVFPPENGLPHVTEERILSDTGRLNLLRDPDVVANWDIVAKDLPFYYRCTAFSCLEIDGEALAVALGLRPDAHPRFLTNPGILSPYWGIIAILVTLLLCIAALVQSRRNAGPRRDIQSYRFGKATINPNHMTAVTGNQISQLNKRDLKLLAMFKDNQGSVLSKNELYDAAWGRDFHANSRALEQHILTLRKKLSPKDGRQQIIETVHGSGYRFNG